MTERQWLPPEQWWASLPTAYVSAAGLITDAAERVLLVKPNYRDHWGLPGGVVEADEPPHLGCAREIREEIGLDLPGGRLLVVSWAAAAAERPRPAFYFVFDHGVVDADTPIRLQEEELDAYAFVPADELGEYLNPAMADRVPAALRARDDGGTHYLAMNPVARA